jgi:hypothetical protein
VELGGTLPKLEENERMADEEAEMLDDTKLETFESLNDETY